MILIYDYLLINKIIPTKRSWLYVNLPTHDSHHTIQFIVMFDDKSNDIIDIWF